MKEKILRQPIQLLLFTGLCAALVVVGLLVTRPLHVTDIDIGNEGEFIYFGETTTFQNFYVFHDPESWDGRSFRWTDDRGALTLPFIQRAGPLALDIVACGCRLDGSSVPVTLLVNNQYMATLSTDDHWRRYSLPVPPHLEHPEHGIMVDLRAPVWTDASGRELGVAVDRVVVRQVTPAPLVAPGSLSALLVGLLALVIWQRPLMLLPLLTACWLLLNAFYVPQFLPRWLYSSLGVAGLVLCWSLVRFRPAAPETAPRPAWTAGLLVSFVLATGVGLWPVLATQVLGHWVIDDAYISFRYAQNLVEGYGLVFNPGEYVEGYTNFLWTMMLAGALAFGFEPVMVAAVLTLLLAYAILLLTVALAQRFVAPPWAWAAAALLSLNSPFLLYSARGSGMETALFTALILAALLALLTQRWLLAGLLVALTLMTRPDGILLAGVAGLYALWQGWRERDPAAARWRWLEPATRYGLVLVVLYVPYFLWRWSYYGYLLPNTFYVKVGSTQAQVWRGVEYLLDFGRSGPLLALALVGAAVGWWLWRRQRDEMALLHGLLLLTMVYIVAVGGDWMPGMRFFVPILPLLALTGVWGLAALAQHVPVLKPASIGLVALAAVILGASLPADTSHTRSPIWIQNYAVRRHREIGRWINANTYPGTWLATAVVGAIPYYADRPTIDMLGLTDEHIAHVEVPELGAGRAGHEKTDLDYTLSRQPAIIPYKGSDLFWGHPGFQQAYELESFAGPEGHGVRLYLRYDAEFPRAAQPDINPAQR